MKAVCPRTETNFACSRVAFFILMLMLCLPAQAGAPPVALSSPIADASDNLAANPPVARETWNINPRDFCAPCGDGASHPAGNALGVRTLAQLAATKQSDGSTPFSFVSRYPFGVLFNIVPEQNSFAGSTILTFQSTATIGIQVPSTLDETKQSPSVQVSDLAVTSDDTKIVPGTPLSGMEIAAGTTVSAIMSLGVYSQLVLSTPTTGAIHHGEYLTAYVSPRAGALTLPVLSTSMQVGDLVTDSSGCVKPGTQVDYVNIAKGEIQLSVATRALCPSEDVLTFTPSWLTKVASGMTVQGPVGSIAAETSVASVNASTGQVTLSRPLTGAVAPQQLLLGSNPRTTLATPLAAGATTMSVASAAAWPTGNFLAQIAGQTSETVEVIRGQDPTTWTIKRGATPREFPIGAIVRLPASPQPITFYRPFTDAEAVSLEMDGLALQAAIARAETNSSGSSVDIPAGTFWRTSAPLILPISSGHPDWPLMSFGGVRGEATISPIADFGPDTAALSCGDPTGKYTNARGLYRGSGSFCFGQLHNLVVTPAANASPKFAFGQRPKWNGMPVAMDGIKQGPRLRWDDVTVEYFRYGAQATMDHTRLMNSLLYNNFGGLRMDDSQANLFGDDELIHLFITGNAECGLCVAPFGWFGGVIEKAYLGTNPYAVLCEAGVGAGMCLQGATIENTNAENLGCGFIADASIQDGWMGNGGVRGVYDLHELNNFHTGDYGSPWVHPIPAGGCQWRAYYDMAFVGGVVIEDVWPNDYPVQPAAYAHILRTQRTDNWGAFGNGGFTMRGNGVINLIQNAASSSQSVVSSPDGMNGTLWWTGGWRYITLEGPTFAARPMPFGDDTAVSLPLGSLVEWGPTVLSNFPSVQRAGKTKGAAFAGVSLQKWGANPTSLGRAAVFAFAGSNVPLLTTRAATAGELIIPDTENFGQATETKTAYGPPPAVGLIYQVGAAGVSYGELLQSRR